MRDNITFIGGFMNNLNSVLIEGNITNDPIFRTISTGTPVCTFGIASHRCFKYNSEIEQEVSFFDIETWSKLAEACRDWGHKGRSVRVVGRLKQDRWNDSEGKRHAKVFIIAEHVEFLKEYAKHANEEQPQEMV
ncbi:MAG: single-stranded DNA-binding protein [Treponema sp.]|jgi:single-strand DNA-binding protein|nr:single-stranded DNA-binding protein [Treponema sp.]